MGVIWLRSGGCGNGGYEYEGEDQESVEEKPDRSPSSHLETQEWLLGLLNAHLAAVLSCLSEANIGRGNPIMIYHELTSIRDRNRDSRPKLTKGHPIKLGTGFILLPAPLFLPFTSSESDYPSPSKSRTRLVCVTCRKNDSFFSA